MSTTFGVKIKGTGEIRPIARRVGIGGGKCSVYFTDELACMLPDTLEVEAIDNSNQGINTIGDIKQAIENQKSEQNETN